MLVLINTTGMNHLKFKVCVVLDGVIVVCVKVARITIANRYITSLYIYISE